MNIRTIVMIIAAFALGLVLGMALRPGAGTVSAPPATPRDTTRLALSDTVYMPGRTRIVEVPSVVRDTIVRDTVAVAPSLPVFLPAPWFEIVPNTLEPRLGCKDTDSSGEHYGKPCLSHDAPPVVVSPVLDSVTEADTALVRVGISLSGRRYEIIDTIGVQYWHRARLLGVVTRPLSIPIYTDSTIHGAPPTESSRAWYWDAALVGAGIIIPLILKYFVLP